MASAFKETNQHDKRETWRMIVPQKDASDGPPMWSKYKPHRSIASLKGRPRTGKIKGILVPSRLGKSFAQSSKSFFSDAYCQHWLRNSLRNMTQARNGEKDETAMRGLRSIFE
jgi:hypothetical protein